MTRPLTILWKLSKKSLKFLCNLNSLAIKYILDTYCVYFTARDFSLFFKKKKSFTWNDGLESLMDFFHKFWSCTKQSDKKFLSISRFIKVWALYRSKKEIFVLFIMKTGIWDFWLNPYDSLDIWFLKIRDNN